MANERIKKLELTWAGKDAQISPEPRILLEQKDKAYGDPDSENMLIHGDNLLALKSLEDEFAGQVKCIYIDPPYNTGSAWDSYDDGYEHSIWLSLMRDRLELLHSLLAEEGSIWISIDDHETSYLRLLCDEIFGRTNFVAQLPTIMNLKGNQDEFAFAGSHEYTLVFAKNKKKLKMNLFPITDDSLEDWEEDDIGPYKQGANLKATGINAPREKRPNLFFPIYVLPDDTVSLTPKDGAVEMLPITDGKEMSWRWSKERFLQYPNDIIIKRSKNEGISVYKKQRPELGDLPSKKPKTLFYKPEYSSGNGTNQIKALFGRKAFDYPKPEELISDFILLSTNPGDLILDSFLGSGTSAAVAHKMGRRWIGIELTDNAYELCAPRLQKVIDGEQGGISKSVGWTGGGGFKFYELASSLVVKDTRGFDIISKEYNGDMLAEAMCKIMGYKYRPDKAVFWKQGKGTENNWLFTTTMTLTEEYLEEIHEELGGESLLICCGGFTGNQKAFKNIAIKRIPKTILEKCEWNKPGYPLPVKEDFTEKDFEIEVE